MKLIHKGQLAKDAGIYAPACTIFASTVLYAFRWIYGEVVTALPLNGGIYNLLLNSSTKRMASIVACLTILSYLATAVVSSVSAMHYLNCDDLKLPGALGILSFFAILMLLGIKESGRFVNFYEQLFLRFRFPSFVWLVVKDSYLISNKNIEFGTLGERKFWPECRTVTIPGKFVVCLPFDRFVDFIDRVFLSPTPISGDVLRQRNPEVDCKAYGSHLWRETNLFRNAVCRWPHHGYHVGGIFQSIALFERSFCGKFDGRFRSHRVRVGLAC